jgi:hypothetical protein
MGSSRPRNSTRAIGARFPRFVHQSQPVLPKPPQRDALAPLQGRLVLSEGRP